MSNVLVDSGYYSEKAVLTAESQHQPATIYAAMKRQSHGRSIAQLEADLIALFAGKIVEP